MSSRRQSITEARYPAVSEFIKLSRSWSSDASGFLLDLIWRAYDALAAEVLLQIDLQQSDEDLERSVTQLLEPRIRRLMTGAEPFYVQHGSYEHETRALPPAQPPQYDLAFVMNANPRIMWPAEAKVIRTEKAVAAYVAELKGNYLTCRYAPFAREAAMLGYLRAGDPRRTLCSLGRKIPCTMRPHASFKDRPHACSSHTRKVPPSKRYYKRFKCHHMIMEMTPSGAKRPPSAAAPQT